MKTYLEIMVSSEGSAPSLIKTQLLNLGFKATKGNYDFVYEWNKDDADINELIMFADKVHSVLRSHKVFFKIETI
jgi:hypothetical protein